MGFGMIVLDTHIWIWWMSDPDQLSLTQRDVIKSAERYGIGISVISCWEVAKLVERGRLQLDRPVLQWLQQALMYPGISLIELTPEIAVESTQLPGLFHRDPADQIIMATARILDWRLITRDQKLIDYTFVETVA